MVVLVDPSAGTDKFHWLTGWWLGEAVGAGDLLLMIEVRPLVVVRFLAVTGTCSASVCKCIQLTHNQVLGISSVLSSARLATT